MADHDLPDRIRFFRLEHEWSMRELGRRMGCSHSTVKNWERGDAAPNFHKLPQLANVFGLSLKQFFSAPIRKKRRTRKGA